LIEQEKKLFNLWYQFRNGQINRSDLGKGVEPIRAEILSILLGADEIQLDKKDTSPLAKTVRTCRKLLKLGSALGLFVRQEGVEPTNNAAERAIRAAVILSYLILATKSYQL
jgi:transposase